MSRLYEWASFMMPQAGPRNSLLALTASALALLGCNAPNLTQYDMKRAKEFILSSLPELRIDPSNRFADDARAAALGEKLFFDARLSATNEVSCGTCHQPEGQFQDDRPRGLGISETPRRTMPLAGVQWGDWFFWDGRKDSQWSQALEPFETAAEHGLTRDVVAREVLTRYRPDYEAVFGTAPDTRNWPYKVSLLVEGGPQDNWQATPKTIRQEINTVFANIGKALAAFQRTIVPQENRVDRFFEARLRGRALPEHDQLSRDEIAGFKLFTGKARCDNCHSGPLYSDGFFHNTGVPIANTSAPDYGRAAIVATIKLDEFSCWGDYSDAAREDCRELNFMSENIELFKGAFKTPSLRGVSKRPPYMHAGQIETLEKVIEHYVLRPDPFGKIVEVDGTVKSHGRHSEVPEIELNAQEKQQLLAFLRAL